MIRKWIAVELSFLAVLAAFLAYAAVIHHHYFFRFVVTSYVVSAVALGFSFMKGLSVRPKRTLRLVAITTLLLTWLISGYESPEGEGYRSQHQAESS